MTTADDVLAFWFADSTAEDAALGPCMARWFGHDPALDRNILARFRPDIERAGRGELDRWARTARGRLALIILMDQFARNAFRGSRRAFAYDAKAVELCLAGLAHGADHALRPVERLFFYLPLLHAEDRANQAHSVACFDGLAADTPGAQRAAFVAWARVARRSRLVIRCFGRYPHRNAVLGRRSGPAERLFLACMRLRARWKAARSRKDGRPRVAGLRRP